MRMPPDMFLQSPGIKHLHVRFVPQLDPSATQNEKELELASQKAHAARRSHALRKQKKRQQEAEAFRTRYNALPHAANLKSNTTSQMLDRSGRPGTLLRRPVIMGTKRLPAARGDPVLLDILPGGNSDPFNTQDLPITPEINKLVTFIRDAYLPGIYITSYMKFKDSAPGAPRLTTIGDGFHIFGQRTVLKVWSSMKEELSDKGRALAWCSSYLPVLAKFSSPATARQLTMLAIKLRTESMKILKQRIEELSLENPPEVSLISQIVSLFRAACKEGDNGAAKVHANIIQRLVDRVEVADRHIQTLFMTCMNNDSELAIAQMRNTFFDYENWIQNQIARFWSGTLENNLPALPPGCQDLHKSIRIPSTRKAAIRLRQYLLYRSTKVNLNDANDMDRTDAVFTNFTTYSQYDSGVLINSYIDLVAGKVPMMKNSSRTIEAGLALTTLHVLRRGIFEATVYGCDHRSSLHVITINHLECTMREAVHSATTADLDHYREALLWVFFYGARFEWRVNKQIKGLTPPRTWFSVIFAKQMRLLQLTQWLQARQVLDKFVFYQFLEPDLLVWFDKVMHADELVLKSKAHATHDE